MYISWVVAEIGLLAITLSARTGELDYSEKFESTISEKQKNNGNKSRCFFVWSECKERSDGIASMRASKFELALPTAVA